MMTDRQAQRDVTGILHCVDSEEETTALLTWETPSER